MNGSSAAILIFLFADSLTIKIAVLLVAASEDIECSGGTKDGERGADDGSRDIVGLILRSLDITEERKCFGLGHCEIFLCREVL